MNPDLTGWVQVNGLCGEITIIDVVEKRVEYDVWYMSNWGIDSTSRSFSGLQQR